MKKLIPLLTLFPLVAEAGHYYGQGGGTSKFEGFIWGTILLFLITVFLLPVFTNIAKKFDFDETVTITIGYICHFGALIGTWRTPDMLVILVIEVALIVWAYKKDKREAEEARKNNNL